MEIGTCRLRRIGLNVLHSALHPRHGLTWTDGTCIYLVPLSITDDEVGNNTPLKLGEFEHVSSLHWSSDTGESHCYLCVVHVNVVSLWKVDGSFPKLSFKQIRKIHATPILQGCLWNPRRDVLCIMNKEQCTFYFRHLNKRGSYSLPPIESGKISCGCWTSDGKSLIVGIKSIILVYQWIDIDHSFNDYALIAWKIPNVHGSLCTLAPLSESRIICTAELCLEGLCESNQSLFQMPDLTPETDTDWSLTDVNDVIKPVTATPSAMSYTESLLHLKSHTRKPSSDSSKLVLFELQAKNQVPTKLHSVNLPGTLSPDLLHCNEYHNVIVVGSNSQNSLHVYKVLNNEFHQLQTLTLAADERPKGVCGVPIHLPTSHKGILVMIGKVQHSDPAFLPSSLEMEYRMKLCFRTITSDEDEVTSSASTGSGQEANCLKDGPVKRRAACCLSNITSCQLSDNILCNTIGSCVGDISSMPVTGSLHGRKRTVSTGHFPLARVGSSPGLTTVVGPLEERLRGLHFRSPSVQSSGGMEQLVKMDLLLANSSLSSTKTQNIEILGDSAQSDDLETEKTDFCEQPASFNNTTAIEKLREEQVSQKRAVKAEHDLTVNNSKDTSKRSRILSKGHYSTTYGSTSSLDMSLEENSLNGPSVIPQGCQQYQGGQNDISKQVSLIEKQLATQEVQISDLQKRVMEISRLLDDARSSLHSSFKPVSEPDIVFLKYMPGESNSKVITKAFVLDNGRLQLNIVKEVFELSTLEIIAGGVSCVVGANVQGYIPLEFQHKDTVTISGRKNQIPQTCLLHQTTSAINGMMPVATNGDVLQQKQGQEQTIQPDVTANHQAVSTVKHTPSTFC